MKGLCQHLDELAEVYALVGDVVEYGLVAVALIFHVTYLHLEPQVFGYLSALYHGAVLAALCLAILVHVDGLGDAVDAAYVVCRLQVGLLQLQLYQSAGEGHHSDVVAGVCLYRHGVALLQFQVVHVVVVALAGVLELYFHQVGLLVVAGDV